MEFENISLRIEPETSNNIKSFIWMFKENYKQWMNDLKSFPFGKYSTSFFIGSLQTTDNNYIKGKTELN